MKNKGVIDYKHILQNKEKAMLIKRIYQLTKWWDNEKKGDIYDKRTTN